jgi:hypothetical protein
VFNSDYLICFPKDYDEGTIFKGDSKGNVVTTIDDSSPAVDMVGDTNEDDVIPTLRKNLN